MNPVKSLLPLQPPLTICLLCYGDHAPLAERVLSSLWRHTDPHAFRLRVAANAPSAATLEVLDRWLPRFRTELSVISAVNLYKAPMMRRLLHDEPLETGWTLWFDDDSYVFRDDWLFLLQCQSRLHPQVAMWGQRFFIRAGELHRQFIRTASWYRDVELAADDVSGRYRVSFIAGGFWAIRTHWLKDLHWPDPRLVHFGDDYMLGEALRQHGALLGNAYSGVAINHAARRAPADTPRTEALC
jgi:GT2 family glycosyltransferase